MKKERYKMKLIDEDPMYFDLYDNLKKKYFESPNDIVKVLNQQDTRIKELEEALKKANINNYLTDYYLVKKENQQLKQQQSKSVIEILQNVVKFINELAWQDVKWDAFQSTMGEFPASPSAIPRYAKKYFDLWKEMFDVNIDNQINLLRGEK